MEGEEYGVLRERDSGPGCRITECMQKTDRVLVGTAPRARDRRMENGYQENSRKTKKQGWVAGWRKGYEVMVIWEGGEGGQDKASTKCIQEQRSL